MSNYTNRLERLEDVNRADLLTKHAPLCCLVFGDENADAAITQLRAGRNWPDDSAHPVQILRVRWGKGECGVEYAADPRRFNVR